MANQKKINQVNQYVKLLEKNPHFLLIGFEKIPHSFFEKLRRELKKEKAVLKVVKNTLLEKAINRLLSFNKLFKELKKKYFPLKNNSAILLFNESYEEGLKSFYRFLKDQKNLFFKGGILDNNLYGNEEILRIAQLPSKEVILGNIIGSLKNPPARLIFAMKFNLLKLTNILKNKSNQS
jgi:large subunit ribosomal protein L10